MNNFLYHGRRLLLSHSIESMLKLSAWRRDRRQGNVQSGPTGEEPYVETPRVPEDFRPLENACFQKPYAFYQMLRDDYPVYQLPNGIYCISRYEDIAALSRDHENYSSTHQGVIAGLRPGQDIVAAGRKLDALAELGLIPADVLALSDPPKHTAERKVGHKGLNARFVKSLDPLVEDLCSTMMDEFIDDGRVEFMQDFAWRLPMRLIIQLLGFPEQDFKKIKEWCVHGIASQSGISTKAELTRSRAASLVFIRYCWSQFLIAKKHPRKDLSWVFVEAANDPDNPMTDQLAVSAIFQLLIAGSDSSATSMGNALKILIDNPDLADEIRDDIDGKLPAFIEEVFRLEAAFQGHFRWTKTDCELHGVKLPRGSRIFLMWASGNRDERVFERPDDISLTRANGKKHLTFGHGIHACIGRELARAEIRIVLKAFLRRTRNMQFDGDAPFLASMFARTLVQLPITFDAVIDTDTDKGKGRRAA